MCGIAGVFSRRADRPTEGLRAQAKAMTDAIAHRGPDGEGFWVDAEAGIALGHRRLAIIDLSDAGAQPMSSACGRYVLSFNGEVYNAEELRPELLERGHRFRGHSDTEIIVEGFSVWGIVPTLRRLVGMFSFAIWDRQEHALTLVRDRLGKKPVYWAQVAEQYLFGSELKALRAADPAWQPQLNRDALASYLRFAYVPHPHCIYRGVNQLPPGHLLTLRAAGEPSLNRYWDLAEVARDGQANRWQGSENEATDALEALLSEAVRCRMVSDVPLGAFLSGGIDSTTVTALMQANASRPVKTFTIGFHEQGYNEAAHAAAVAKHLGTEHTELYVDPQTARDVIPRLADMFDEPFADSSQIPTFLISEMTRRHVTVALSGDGGDEVFAGYNRHVNAASVARLRGRIPSGMRRTVAGAIESVSPAAWTRAGRFLPSRWKQAEFGDKMHKLSATLADDSDNWMIRSAGIWNNPDDVVLGGHEFRDAWGMAGAHNVATDAMERLQYRDTLTYLPDDVMVKVDRATMAVALEARAPLLDHRVVAFSWRLPPDLKLRGRAGKYLLRQVLYRHVPQALMDRPKMGFSIPLGDWLRGPLREWAEDFLSERRLCQEGFFDPAAIRQKWQEHLDGRRSWQHQLWVILMFQSWKQRWLS
jgi:asparagine synthase (glutamine-hydrolysing)